MKKNLVLFLALGLVLIPSSRYAFADSADVFTETEGGTTTDTSTDPVDPVCEMDSDGNPIAGCELPGDEIPAEKVLHCIDNIKIKVKSEISKKKISTLFGLTKILSKKYGKLKIEGKADNCDASTAKGQLRRNGIKQKRVKFSDAGVDEDGNPRCKFKVEGDLKSDSRYKNIEGIMDVMIQGKECSATSIPLQIKNSYFQ